MCISDTLIQQDAETIFLIENLTFTFRGLLNMRLGFGLGLEPRYDFQLQLKFMMHF
jgi:hypothetical protein